MWEKCSQCRGAAVYQAMQYPQQVVLPVQVTESLLHGAGEHAVLQLPQREDELPSENEKQIFKWIYLKKKNQCNKYANLRNIEHFLLVI